MSTRDSPDDVPYSTALATADRSHLYREYDLTPVGNDREDPAGPPADYGERRAAVLSFYGGRCGRCLGPIDRTSRGDGVSLCYLYSVDDPAWALDSLVAMCEGCHDLLTVRTAADRDRTLSRPADAPQFPAPLADPRVAVERTPLSGREVWLRKRLRERTEDHADRRVNVPARDCALGLSTPAARATAMGAALCADWTRDPDEPRLVETWEGLPADTRAAYAECADDVTAVTEAASLAPDDGALEVAGAENDPVPALADRETRDLDAVNESRVDD